ncbi:MAG: MFS transporter [Firmicutes bacterium]|nr:MFS transporter [Bacillota bacterium]
MLTTEQNVKNEKQIFTLVMALIFTDTLLYGSIVPLIPVYTDQFQLSPLSMGVVFAAYALGLLVFSIPLGIMAERYGYRKIFLSGMMGLTLTTMLYGFVNNPGMLFLSRLLQGASAAASWTVGLAMVALLYPRQQGEKLGSIMAAMGIGIILGPPVGGAFYHYLGYRGMFAVLAAFCLLLLFIIWRVDFGRLAGSSQNIRFSIWEVKQIPGLVWLAVVVIITSSSFGMLEVLLPNHLNGRFGTDSLQIGFLFGLMGLVHSLSDIGAGYLSDRHGYPPFIYWGLLAGAVCLPFLALAPSLVLEALVVCLVGVALGAAVTPSQPLMYHLVAVDERLGQNGGAGLAYGIFNTCFSMGMLLGPLLGGMLNKYFDFLISLILFAALFIFAAALFQSRVGKAASRRFSA